MKMRNSCSAIAILAVMACSAAHAQVLGGSVGGALHGSFGGELDSRSTLDSTFGRARAAADQTTGRARDLGANARNRTESTVTNARERGEKVAASTVTAAKAAKSEHVDASGNASASRDGIVAEAAADASAAASLDTKKKKENAAPQPSGPKNTSNL